MISMLSIRHLVRAAVKRGNQHSRIISSHKRYRRYSTEAPSAKLVIFDKDGTLITFEDSWIDWALSMTEKYAERVKKPIQKELFDLLGFNTETRRFQDGLICEPDDVIILTLTSFLRSHGLNDQEAQKFVEDNYFCYESSEHETVPIDDPRAIFSALKENNIAVAVCTSDSLLGYDAMERHLRLKGLCDYALCGDNEAMQPKPHPGNIAHICQRLGIAARDTVMVGDALRDVQMGRQAGVGLAVGVLSGVCDEEHFAGEADVIVNSVKHVLPLVIPGYQLPNA